MPVSTLTNGVMDTPRVDEGLELAQHLTAAHLDRADLGDAVGRWPRRRWSRGRRPRTWWSRSGSPSSSRLSCSRPAATSCPEARPGVRRNRADAPGRPPYPALVRPIRTRRRCRDADVDGAVLGEPARDAGDRRWPPRSSAGCRPRRCRPRCARSPGSRRPSGSGSAARRWPRRSTPTRRSARKVADAVAEASPDLAAAVRDGGSTAAADPVDVAVVAYLDPARRLGATCWPRANRRGGAAERGAADGRGDELDAAARRARRAARPRARGEPARLREARRRGRAPQAETELAELRRDAARPHPRAARRPNASATPRRAAGRAAQAELGRLGPRAHETELRRLRGRLAEAERAAEAARRGARTERDVDDARLWLLVDTLVQAATGVRRELSLPPPAGAPGRRGRPPAGATGRAARRGRRRPALDRLLALPNVHLVVDGYNVTKTGYGELSLAEQRTRLVGALAPLGGAVRRRGHGRVRRRSAAAGPAAGAARRAGAVQRGRRDRRRPDPPARRRRAAPGRPVVVVTSDRQVVARHRAATAPGRCRRRCCSPASADCPRRRTCRRAVPKLSEPLLASAIEPVSAGPDARGVGPCSSTATPASRRDTPAATAWSPCCSTAARRPPRRARRPDEQAAIGSLAAGRPGAAAAARAGSGRSDSSGARAGHCVTKSLAPRVLSADMRGVALHRFGVRVVTFPRPSGSTAATPAVAEQVPPNRMILAIASAPACATRVANRGPT